MYHNKVVCAKFIFLFPAFKRLAYCREQASSETIIILLSIKIVLLLQVGADATCGEIQYASACILNFNGFLADALLNSLVMLEDITYILIL